MRLELLGREHRRLLHDFTNDEPELVVYLRRWALPHQERDHIGRTWLAIDDDFLGPRVAGYVTLAAASLERSSVTSGDLDRLPRFPIPAILLARLAVDARIQGQGVGKWLFGEALLLTLRLVTEGPIAFRVLITDAKNERAVSFYERRGLVALTGSTPRRMVLDLKPLISPQPA
jgi:GNAT superfamily N-acetyltransferase